MLKSVFSSYVSVLGLFLFLRLVTHGGYGVYRAGDGRCGRCGPALGEIFQAQVFRVVEMLRERLGNSIKFVFNHDINVIAVQTIMHQSGEEVSIPYAVLQGAWRTPPRGV